MALSNPKPNTFLCKIRKNVVVATPEEIVRQGLLNLMIEKLEYPFGGFAIEKSLREMPHLTELRGRIPKRRSDLIFFDQGIHPSFPLYPLLLIECKSVKLTRATVNQALGYNAHLKAYFITIANQDEIRTGWFCKERTETIFVQGIPHYKELRSLKEVVLNKQAPLQP